MVGDLLDIMAMHRLLRNVGRPDPSRGGAERRREGKNSAIAAVDVARVIAEILSDPTEHIGQTHHLTGPISQDMDASHGALGRTISYVDVLRFCITLDNSSSVDTRGNVAIEFALICSPPLIDPRFGIIEVGCVFGAITNSIILRRAPPGSFGQVKREEKSVSAEFSAHEA